MRINGAWFLALILGLVGASYIRPLTTDIRPSAPGPRPLASTEPDATTKAKVQVAYGKLPLHFEANQGQSDEQVKFLSRGSGYTLFLTSSEAVLALRNAERRTQNDELKNPHSSFIDHHSSFSTGTVLRMQLVGANPNPQVAGLDELPGKSHYFLGNDPQNWHTNVPTYARVQYKDIYPGIDLIYYGNQRQLEYDFVVAPGADPKAIRLAFDGIVGAGMPPHPVPLVAQPSWLRAGWKPAPLGEREPMPRVLAPSPLAADKGRYHEPKDGKAGLHPLSDSPPSKGERKEVPSPLKGEACPECSRRGQDGGRSGLPLQIDDNGDLILHTAGGELRLHKPRIYQEINGIKHPIPGSYVLLSPQSSSLVTSSGERAHIELLSPQSSSLITFDVAAYDPSKPLIIDPVLSYSTYLGGSSNDRGNNSAVDSSGNVYVLGRISTHSHQEMLRGKAGGRSDCCINGD